MKKVNWQYLIDLLLFISATGVIIIGLFMAFVIPRGPSTNENVKYFLGLHRHDWGDIHLYLGLAFVILTVVHLLLGWNWIKGRTRAIFGTRWKVALTSASLLPIGVLACWWLVFPGEPGSYEHRNAESRRPDRGVLAVGQLPKYNASKTIPKNPPETETGFSPLRQQEPVSVGDKTATTLNEEEPAVEQRHDLETGLIRGRESEDISGVLITGQTTLGDIERDIGISKDVLARHLGLPGNISPDDRLGRLRKRYQFTMEKVRELITSLLEERQKTLNNPEGESQ